jgi:YgiT-type zinc finger domain-containing protein
MDTNGPKERCEFCDGTLESRIVRARFAFRGQTVYVDRVPAWVCAHCGEQYYDAPVFKRLEGIAKQAHRIKKKVAFPLADYDDARV